MQPYEISFQDGDFAVRAVWRWTKLEGLHRRWVPCGMPRLSPYLERTAFFLYGLDPKGNSRRYIGPLGTGVVVGFHTWTPPIVWSYYAVTARHVIRSGAHAIRLNTRDGASRFLDLEMDEWVSKPDEDVAVADITDRMQKGDAISYVSFDQFITPERMTELDLSIGEDGFMLGLFTSQPGDKRNRIAARFGNISMLAAQDAPIERTDKETGEKFKSPCHVFDIHSRPGFSGSPVFVYRTPDGDLRDLENRTRGWRAIVRNPVSERRSIRGEDWDVEVIDETGRENRFMRLLGIHANQYHEEITLRKVRGKRPKAESDESIKDGEKVRFPGSMTIIVPAWCISKLIEESTHLKAIRDARHLEAKAEEESKPNVAEAEIAETATQAEPEDANPHGKEDFTSLLNAAATKKPPAA